LHKFCQKCIEDYNRKYKKECPQCRNQILSRRHLRLDLTMQGIIGKLVENLEDFNEVEEKRRRVKISKTLRGKEYKEICKKNRLRIN
jgi:hypothetical protein